VRLRPVLDFVLEGLAALQFFAPGGYLIMPPEPAAEPIPPLPLPRTAPEQEPSWTATH
jgi:hypothetical protein